MAPLRPRALMKGWADAPDFLILASYLPRLSGSNPGGGGGGGLAGPVVLPEPAHGPGLRYPAGPYRLFPLFPAHEPQCAGRRRLPAELSLSGGGPFGPGGHPGPLLLAEAGPRPGERR